jgi:hypothetical protein
MGPSFLAPRAQSPTLVSSWPSQQPCPAKGSTCQCCLCHANRTALHPPLTARHPVCTRVSCYLGMPRDTARCRSRSRKRDRSVSLRRRDRWPPSLPQSPLATPTFLLTWHGSLLAIFPSFLFVPIAGLCHVAATVTAQLRASATAAPGAPGPGHTPPMAGCPCVAHRRLPVIQIPT